MKESQITKKCRSRKILLGILHFLLVFGPLLFFFPYAFIIATTTTKAVLGISVVISLILAAINVLCEAKHSGFHKSIMWLLIVSIMLVLTALSQVRAFIFIMAGTCFIDELIINPLYNRSKTQLITNREIDKRMV